MSSARHARTASSGARRTAAASKAKASAGSLTGEPSIPTTTGPSGASRPPAHDHHRAASVCRQADCHGADQQAGDPAQAAVTDHHELRRARLRPPGARRETVRAPLIRRRTRFGTRGRLCGLREIDPRLAQQHLPAVPDPSGESPYWWGAVTQPTAATRRSGARRRAASRAAHRTACSDDSEPSTPATTAGPTRCPSMPILPHVRYQRGRPATGPAAADVLPAAGASGPFWTVDLRAPPAPVVSGSSGRRTVASLSADPTAPLGFDPGPPAIPVGGVAAVQPPSQTQPGRAEDEPPLPS